MQTELKPEFFSTSSEFRVVLKNINYNMYDRAHDRVHDRAHDERIDSLLEFCSIARTREEMQAYLGISSREYFRKNILKPLLESAQLKMVIPDKPKSKRQKYITTLK